MYIRYYNNIRLSN